MFVLTDRQSLILKVGKKKNFSYETKAPMSFIPIRRISLWCPIFKRKETICEPVFVPIANEI